MKGPDDGGVVTLCPMDAGAAAQKRQPKLRDRTRIDKPTDIVKRPHYAGANVVPGVATEPPTQFARRSDNPPAAKCNLVPGIQTRMDISSYDGADAQLAKEWANG